MRAGLTAAVLILACVQTQAAAIDSNEAEALFLSAAEASQDGRHDEAIATLRLLLEATPAPRVKLELARLLYVKGEYSEALGHFTDVYRAPETPQTVKRNILPYMEAAELRVMRVRYGARIVTDSNPSRVGDGGTIFFNGIPFEYEPPTPKEASYGVEPWFSVERLWENGMLTKFYSSARLFEDEDLISGRFQAAVGRQATQIPGLFVQMAIDAEINKDNSYVLPSVEAWKRFKLGGNAGFGLGGQIGYMFAENGDISGSYYRPYVFADWTLLPNATVFGRVSAEHLNSRNDFYTYFAPKGSIGVAMKAGGFEVVPQVTLTETMFSEYNPAWLAKRNDLTVRPEITFSHESIQWNGIKPQFNVFYEERQSNVRMGNVAIYDYDQFGGFVSFQRPF